MREFFLFFSLFVFLSKMWLILGNEEEILSEFKESSYGNNKFNLTEVYKVMLKLIEANEQLILKVNHLENKLKAAQESMSFLESDLHFFNPTVEVGEVYLYIQHWKNALENDFEGVSYPFEAGRSIGALSRWAFFVSKLNNSLSVHLQLENEGYKNKEEEIRALFAGFTLALINSEGKSVRNLSHPSRNILEAENKRFSLNNVMSFEEIEDPLNNILRNDSLQLAFKFELLGKGHKLYKQDFTPQTSKDRQIVEFEVKNLSGKLEKDLNWIGNESWIAFTRFELNHPFWKLITKWNIGIGKDLKDKKSLTFTLALADSIHQFGWTQLFATFKLNIWNNGQIIFETTGEVNDYVDKNVFVEEILSAQHHSQLKEKTIQNDTLIFKIYLTVYGKNAKYYLDII